MGFFSRKKEQKESRTDAFIHSQTYSGAIYPEWDTRKIAEEAYMQNLIAFRSIYMVAQAVSTVPWNVFKKDKDGDAVLLDSGDIFDLIKRPNPSQGFSGLMSDTTSYYLLQGNSYVERVKLQTGSEKGLPKELYSLRPDRMKIVTNSTSVIGYKYGEGVSAVTFDVDPITKQSDILHLKTFNPLDDFYGFPATMAAAGNIDNSNDALSWNRSMYKNGARPGNIITMERSMAPEQYTRFKEQMQDKYTGPKNAGKTMILDNLGEGKVSMQTYGWSPKEVDFLESNREDARRISMAYGVPAQLLGIPGDNTYSNMKEARQAFWEDTVLPLLTYLKDEFNNWMFNDNLEYIEFSAEGVPAFADKRNTHLKMIEASTVLTLNEKRKELGYESIEGGDAIFMNLSNVPLLGDDAVVDYEDSVEKEEEQAKEALKKLGVDEAEIDYYLGLK